MRMNASSRWLRLVLVVAFLLAIPLAVLAADVAGVYEPKTVKDVTITDSFWRPKLEACRDNAIPAGWQNVEGAYQEVEHMATGTGPTPEGWPWTEANLHKLTEAVAYAVAQWPSQPDTLNPAPPGRTPAANLNAHLNAIISKLQAAQATCTGDRAGYMHAYCINHEGQFQWNDIYPGRFPIGPWNSQSLGPLHDGYVAGHLCEAAIAHYNATGSTSMLTIAKKAADQAYLHFVTQQNPGFCGHPEYELALVDLYRVTGNTKYLDLSQRFIEQHGKTPAPTEDLMYAQDDLPAKQQTSINGHAVRAVFFYTGVVDLALAGRSDYYNPSVRVWKNAAKRKMYVTGSVGVYGSLPSGHEWEGFSLSDYDLPNNGYCESCAAGAMVNFAHRMARLKGDGDSMDELERALYNGVLHGISLDGKMTYYGNPLTDQNNPRYNSWVCCPPLLYRTLLGVGKYIYGSTNSDIYVNLFIGSTCTFNIGGKSVPLTMTTSGYPFDGRVTITVNPATPTNFALRIRFPGWCRNGLLRLNNKIITTPQVTNRYIVINRQWSDRDVVTLTMAMTPMRIEAHPSVAADTGRVCIQYGPIIYGLEGIDNGGGSLADPVLSANPDLRTEYDSGLLNGVRKITAKDQSGNKLTFIPFYALANRANSWQRVWIQQQSKTTGSAAVWTDRLYREYTP